MILRLMAVLHRQLALRLCPSVLCLCVLAVYGNVVGTAGLLHQHLYPEYLFIEIIAVWSSSLLHIINAYGYQRELHVTVGVRGLFIFGRLRAAFILKEGEYRALYPRAMLVRLFEAKG